ncbi:MAG: radical SAM protein [Candidatus Omnitrophica bacterium]|nr:radical SAM protein [Candidatus Omnitrophota bacterium]
MKYLYGPVQSRRLGFSLGVSVIPFKTCSFDCIYCQLGRTGCHQTLRSDWVKGESVIAELGEWFQAHPREAKKLDYVTFAGCGEPTLHSRLGEIMDRVREITGTPIAVITNASLFNNPEVRRMVSGADLVIPSLDAATSDVFRKINRPAPGIHLQDIIDGLIAFRREYSGNIWLEIMLLAGVNDAPEHIAELRKLVDKIKPDKVQLNSPVRAPEEAGVEGIPGERLEEIRTAFGPACELV